MSPTNATLRSTSATYDPNGNVLSAKDARGTVNSFSYDVLGRLTQTTQPISATDSITNSFGYDANGQRTRHTDGRGNRFRTTFNTWSLPESQIDADGSTFTTTYDTAGRVNKALSPGGVDLTYNYDIMNNLTAVSGTGAEVSTADRVFGYDAAGRITSLSGAGGSNTLSYDDRGLLTSIAGPSGDSSFAWTADGLMASRTDAAGTTSYAYDAAGRLASAGNATAGLQTAYSYNSLSQLSQITYGTNQNRRTFGYDDLHRLTTDELKTSGGTSIGKITYGWDLNDNETSKVTTGFAGSTSNTYTYDWANRLTSWNATAYTYDKSGNRTQAGGKTFSYDAANRLQSASDGTTYEYTARGTLKRTTVGTVSMDTQSDAFGQVMRQYSSATEYSDYSYDGLGRVIKSGFAYTGTGNQLAKDPTASYIRGPGGELMGSKGGASTYAWTDRHSDVVAQFTASGTTLAGSTTYEPFGKVAASNGMQGSLGYQSEWTDAQTNRVNMHARWYNPETGQFDSRDTVGVPNRFNYAENNPLTATDPSGHGPQFDNSDDFRAWHNTQVTKDPEMSLEPCKRSIEWRLRFGVMQCGGSGVGANVTGFDGRKGQTVNNCPHGNYDWIFGNCTGYRTDPSNVSCIADVTHAIEMCFTQDQLAGLNPAIVASELDREVGRRGGYGDDVNQAQILMAVALQVSINKAAERQASLDERNAEAKCQASWACRNAGWVGDVVGAIAGVVVGALCLVATAGAGSIGCAMLGGFVGGFVGSLTTGLMQGKSGAALWGGALIDGLIGGVIGALTLGLGSALGAGARRLLNTVGGKAISGFLGGGVRSAGAKLADTALGRMASVARGLIAKAQDKFGRCAVSMAGQVAVAGAAAGVMAHSFDPSTGVLMADGTTKRLDEVAVGDKVTATDPETGRTSAEPVTALHVNIDNDLVDVTVSAGEPADTRDAGEGQGERSTRGPTATLHTTAHHPFWDATAQQWVNASELRPGVSTLVGPDGRRLQVIAVQKVPGFAQMRDLTVATVHTYYAIAGNQPVLVHNCNSPHGFDSKAQYNNFVRTMDGGLEDAGYAGTQAAFAGSSVTGIGYTSRLPFGPHSDFDMALAGDNIFNKAKELGIVLRSRGTRTGPLGDEEIEALGLTDMRQQLSTIAGGRDVNFMIYSNIGGVTARGPSIPARVCGC